MDKFDLLIQEKNFIKSNIEQWNDLSLEKIIFTKLEGGLSRDVFKVYYIGNEKNIQPQYLIFRKFREHSSIEGRNLENSIFNILSDNGISPKLYQYNEEFRIEEYFESKNITHFELNDEIISKKLALSLGAFHKLKIDNIKLNKINYIKKRLQNQIIITQMINNCEQEEIYNKQELEFVKKVKYLASEEELDFIFGEIDKYDLVLCHNDIWMNNILINDKKDVYLIDYEKADYNFQGYDIAKLLRESIYTRPKPPSSYYEIVEDYFPNENQIKIFLHYYLYSFYSTANILENKILINELLEIPFEKLNILMDKTFPLKNDDEIKLIYNDIYKQYKLGLVVSTYFCAFTMMIYGKQFTNEFDLIKFARDEFGFYEKYKNDYLNNYLFISKK